MTTTHPDLAALLAAVCQFPADDTPRLVLADWLDEHEQHERAEFIRAQVAIARIDRGETWGSDKDEYRRAEKSQRKYAERRREWSGINCPACEGASVVEHTADGWSSLEQCDHCAGTGYAPVEFRRGFVYRVRCRMGDVLREVTCTKCRDDGTLIGDPECEWCDGSGRMASEGDSDATEDCAHCDVMTCPDCGGTKRLGYELTPWAAGALAAHPVTRWEIVDREPWEQLGRFVWWSWINGEYRHELPPPVAEDLFYSQGGLGAGTRNSYFRIEAEARDALALAVGRVARELAGLPEAAP